MVMRSSVLSLFFVCGCSTWALISVSAQELPNTPAASTDAEALGIDTPPIAKPAVEPDTNIDDDFRFMGEFEGDIDFDGVTQTLALQLRPIGDGRFDAVTYSGGLPGTANHQPEKTRLIGQRFQDFLVLSGGPYALFVDTDQCRLIKKDGSQAGVLTRVNRESTTLGAPAPEQAIVLYANGDTSNLINAKVTTDELLEQGADFNILLQDFDLHLEFRLPYLPSKSDQGRANSGVYILSRYECQILDSFAQDAVFNGCGAIYRFRAPDLNLCFPPLAWQTYDIRFTAPRWSVDGKKLSNARISSWVNGVAVQDDVEVPAQTGHGKLEEATILPTRLQDHNDEVRFRNVWAIDRGITNSIEFPVLKH